MAQKDKLGVQCEGSDSRLPAVGGELGVDVLSRVVVLTVQELRGSAESLSAVLKALGVRGSSSPPLGQRLIVVAAHRVQPHIPPQAKRRANVVRAPAELWRREVRALPGCPVLRRRVQALGGSDVRRVRVPQERGGGREEVQGPRGGARFPGNRGGRRRGGGLGGMPPVPAVALLTFVGHRWSSRAPRAPV